MPYSLSEAEVFKMFTKALNNARDCSTKFEIGLNIRCGHVVRDFESEAKTR